VQVAVAEETLRPFAERARLTASHMELNPGVPLGYFDLVFSVYGLGWTTDLPGTLALVADYLRPAGVFVFSGERRASSHLAQHGKQCDGEERSFSRFRLMPPATTG